MKLKYLWYGIIGAMSAILIAVLVFSRFDVKEVEPMETEVDYDSYFDEGWRDRLAESKTEWFKEIKTLMHDEDISDEAEITHEYTLANSVSFMGIYYTHIKVYDDKTGEMVCKHFDSEFEDEGELVYNNKIALTKKQTAEIIDVINDHDFWDIPFPHPAEIPGMDGYTLFIEGKTNKKYKFIAMWNPGPEFRIEKIYREIQDLAELWGMEM